MLNVKNSAVKRRCFFAWGGRAFPSEFQPPQGLAWFLCAAVPPETGGLDALAIGRGPDLGTRIPDGNGDTFLKSSQCSRFTGYGANIDDCCASVAGICQSEKPEESGRWPFRWHVDDEDSGADA